MLGRNVFVVLFAVVASCSIAIGIEPVSVDEQVTRSEKSDCVVEGTVLYRSPFVTTEPGVYRTTCVVKIDREIKMVVPNNEGLLFVQFVITTENVGMLNRIPENTTVLKWSEMLAPGKQWLFFLKDTKTRRKSSRSVLANSQDLQLQVFVPLDLRSGVVPIQ